MKNLCYLLLLSIGVLFHSTASSQDAATIFANIENFQKYRTPYKPIPSLTTNKKVVAKTTADSFAIPVAYTIKRYDTFSKVYVPDDSTSIKWKANHGRNFDITEQKNLSIFEFSHQMLFYNFEHYMFDIMQMHSFNVYPNFENLTINLYSGGTPTATEHKFDYIASNDELQERITINDQDSIFYTYDDSGRLTHQFTYIGGDLTKDTVIIDSLGRVTALYHILSNGEVTINGYFYNANNDVVAKVKLALFSNSSIKSLAIDSIFYSTNRDSSILYFFDVSANSYYKFITTHSTFENNLLKTLYSKFHDPSYPDIGTRVNRNALGQITNIYGYQDGDTTTIYTMNYNANNLLTDMTQLIKEPFGWVPFSKLNINYNAYNLPTSIFEQSKFNPTTLQFEINHKDFRSDIYYDIERDTTNSINKIEVSNINLFPNPNNGIINIQTSNNENLQSIKIFDAMGRLLRHYKNINKQHHTMNIEDLASGNYIMETVTNKGKTTAKFIKE